MLDYSICTNNGHFLARAADRTGHSQHWSPKLPSMPIVLPGDIVQLPESSYAANSIRLGPGLLYPSEAAKAAGSLALLATHAGVVGKVNVKGKSKQRGTNQEGWWVEINTRRVSSESKRNPGYPAVIAADIVCLAARPPALAPFESIFLPYQTQSLAR